MKCRFLWMFVFIALSTCVATAEEARGTMSPKSSETQEVDPQSKENPALTHLQRNMEGCPLWDAESDRRTVKRFTDLSDDGKAQFAREFLKLLHEYTSDSIREQFLNAREYFVEGSFDQLWKVNLCNELGAVESIGRSQKIVSYRESAPLTRCGERH